MFKNLLHSFLCS